MKNTDPEIEYIKKRMKELGLNQRSLALKAGCKEDAVRNRLTGKAKRWRADTRAKIMSILGDPDKSLSFDDDLMSRAITSIERAASNEGRKLTLQEAMEATVELYKHVIKYKKTGALTEPNEALAVLILQKHA